MKAGVLNIGSEILSGHTINTNVSVIAKSCQKFGIEIEEQIAVPDRKDLIIESFKNLYEKYNLIFVTGGLGPTEDDITAKAISEALNKKLIRNEKVILELKRHFESMKRIMTENNEKQSYFPESSKIIKNKLGTANGFYLEENGKTVLVMPGPTQELKQILDEFLKNYKSLRDKIRFKSINTFGLGESMVETRLRKLKLNPEIDINTYFNYGGVEIILKGINVDENEFNKNVEIIEEEFRENIFGEDISSISKELLHLLIENNFKIAIAESCTGGNIASEFTKNDGASQALICSLVTYTELAKMKELKVKEETLSRYTAVSSETATEMLNGLKEKYDADYYIITTGYASPPQGMEELNGQVFIGIYDRKNDYKEISENKFRGSRAQIIERVTNRAFIKIINRIKEAQNGN